MKKIPYIVGSFVLLALDLWSKTWISTNLATGNRIPVIDGFFYLTYLKNTGSAWSMFEGLGPVVIVLGVIVAGVIGYYFYKGREPLLLASLALVFAGNLGNLYDRVALGFVRDMLSFNLFGYWFPVFNVADSCMVVGVLLLFIYTYLDDKKKESQI